MSCFWPLTPYALPFPQSSSLSSACPPPYCTTQHPTTHFLLHLISPWQGTMPRYCSTTHVHLHHSFFSLSPTDTAEERNDHINQQSLRTTFITWEKRIAFFSALIIIFLNHNKKVLSAYDCQPFPERNLRNNYETKHASFLTVEMMKYGHILLIFSPKVQFSVCILLTTYSC